MQKRNVLGHQLVVLVEPLHPERQPSHARLQKRSAQSRENVEHAAADECRNPAHHLERIRRRVLDEKIIAHLESSEPIRRTRGAAVKACRQIGIDARLPNRMEPRMVEQLVFHVRRQVNPDRPRLFRYSPNLFRRALRRAHRHHRDALQPRGIRRAVVREPSMVRANHRDFEIDALQRAEARDHRREQHPDIDALAIHVLDSNLRIETAARIRRLAMRLSAGAHQRLVPPRHAERPPGIQLMEIAEEVFRRPRRRDLLQLLELRFEFALEVLIVELVRFHNMAVSVDHLDAVEHEQPPRAQIHLSRIEPAKLKQPI